MNNITDIVKKLIDLTNEKKIEWDYLDNHREVYSKLLLEPRSPLEAKNALALVTTTFELNGKSAFDSDNSFIASINENYIVLCVSPDDKKEGEMLRERLVFMLVPRTFKDVKRYADNDEGVLLRLHTLVKSEFPNSEDIMNAILEM